MNSGDPTPHLERFATYEEACRDFQWNIPEDFNIARAICRRHGDPVTRVALIEHRPAANNIYTFGSLDHLSDKFATVLAQTGIGRGDRVATRLNQSATLATAHLGILKCGAVIVSVPAAASEADLAFILENSSARALIVDEEFTSRVTRDLASTVKAIFVSSDNIHRHRVEAPAHSYWRDVYEASSDFHTVETRTDDLAVISYSLEASGPIAHHYSHQALIANLGAFEMSSNFELGEDAVFWTPNDWSSGETLLGVIYPAWYYGRPVVARKGVFDPSHFLEALEVCGVTNAFLPAEQLRRVAEEVESPSPDSSPLRRIVCTNGSHTEGTLEWTHRISASAASHWGAPGAGILTATCERLFEQRPGTVGRPVPGRRIGILDDSGRVAERGKPDAIAVQLPDPGIAGGSPELTVHNHLSPDGKWFLTSERGLLDSDGYLVISR